MPADLLNLHYTEQLSVDFSEIVIKQMQVKHPNLEWRVEDVRRLKLENSSFDIAIDKASSMRLLGPIYRLLTSLGDVGCNDLRLTMGSSGRGPR